MSAPAPCPSQCPIPGPAPAHRSRAPRERARCPDRGEASANANQSSTNHSLMIRVAATLRRHRLRPGAGPAAQVTRDVQSRTADCSRLGTAVGLLLLEHGR